MDKTVLGRVNGVGQRRVVGSEGVVLGLIRVGRRFILVRVFCVGGGLFFCPLFSLQFDSHTWTEVLSFVS